MFRQCLWSTMWSKSRFPNHLESGIFMIIAQKRGFVKLFGMQILRCNKQRKRKAHFITETKENDERNHYVDLYRVAAAFLQKKAAGMVIDIRLLEAKQEWKE